MLLRVQLGVCGGIPALPKVLSLSILQVTVPGGTLYLKSSVLQLRGSSPVRPPLHSPSGDVLLFNGEVFGGLDIAPGGNDAEALLASLSEADTAEIPALLSRLRGPWALVYWESSASTLWFGRDVMGRRSLLIGHSPDGARALSHPALVLASTHPLDDISESEALSETLESLSKGNSSLPALKEVLPGIHSLCLANSHEEATSSAGLLHDAANHPWQDPALAALAEFVRPEECVEPRDGDGETSASADAAYDSELSFAFEAALQAAVSARVHSSGCGTPCLAHPAPESPHASSPTLDPPSAPSPPLLHPPAPVMIAFSGGVDSTLLALMAHRALPQDAPIDLVSICFQGGRSWDRQAAAQGVQDLNRVAPSRQFRLICVDASLNDLQARSERLSRLLLPSSTVMDLNIGSALWLVARGWGVVGGVSRGEGGEHESRAADGPSSNNGQSNPDSTPRSPVLYPPLRPALVSSAARVVLVGHGADEAWAGYGRHQTALRERGWPGLSAELQKDVLGLHWKNLGRDDRVMADASREVRHPFLDEEVLRLAMGARLPALLRRDKGCLAEDKRPLRDALRRAGLPRAAEMKKRAIQFATGLAKLTNVHRFGSNRRANLEKAGSVRLDLEGVGLGPPAPIPQPRAARRA